MDVHDIVHFWPHNWYGFWRSSDHDYDDVPTLQAVIDPSWIPDDKQRLIAYLERSPIVASSMGQTTCLLCSSDVSACSFQFDGVWLWPRSLTHYVCCHSVVLPDRLIQYIRNRSYTVPKEGEVPHVRLRDLPWPESYGGMRNLSWDS